MDDSLKKALEPKYYVTSYHGIVTEDQIFSWHWERFCREKSQDSGRYYHIHIDFTKEKCIRSWIWENKGYPIVVAFYEVPKKDVEEESNSFEERKGMVPKVYRGPFKKEMLMWKGDFISFGGCLWIAKETLISDEPSFMNEKYYYFSSKIGLNDEETSKK